MKKIAEAKRNYRDKELYEAEDKRGNLYQMQNPAASMVEVEYLDGTKQAFTQDEAPVFNSAQMKSTTVVRIRPKFLGTKSESKKSNNYAF